MLTKKTRADSNTAWAQGGIAAALGPDDSPDLHIADTLQVGCGLSRPDVVRMVVEQGPAVIESLEKFGVQFSRGEGRSPWPLVRRGAIPVVESFIRGMRPDVRSKQPSWRMSRPRRTSRSSRTAAPSI